MNGEARLYDHGNCHCGTTDIQVGCKVDVYYLHMSEEGLEQLRDWLVEVGEV